MGDSVTARLVSSERNDVWQVDNLGRKGEMVVLYFWAMMDTRYDPSIVDGQMDRIFNDINDKWQVASIIPRACK